MAIRVLPIDDVVGAGQFVDVSDLCAASVRLRSFDTHDQFE